MAVSIAFKQDSKVVVVFVQVSGRSANRMPGLDQFAPHLLGDPNIAVATLDTNTTPNVGDIMNSSLDGWSPPPAA